MSYMYPNADLRVRPDQDVAERYRVNRVWQQDTTHDEDFSIDALARFRRGMIENDVIDRPKIKAKVKKKEKLAQPDPISDHKLTDFDLAKHEATTKELAEYDALCHELGLSPSKLASDKAKLNADKARAEVMQEFVSRRIPVYDASEVSAYMASITPSDKFWGWKAFGHAGNSPSRYAYRNGEMLGGTYKHLVPIHILRRMKVVKEMFSDVETKFYVTDYEAKDPDPFIMVAVKGQQIIFGVWDEPGYGDLKTII